MPPKELVEPMRLDPRVSVKFPLDRAGLAFTSTGSGGVFVTVACCPTSVIVCVAIFATVDCLSLISKRRWPGMVAFVFVCV